MASVGSQLQIGQTVQLKPLEYGFQVVLLNESAPGPKVTEIASSHIIFEDEAEGVQTRVPMHLLKSLGAPDAAIQAA